MRSIIEAVKGKGNETLAQWLPLLGALVLAAGLKAGLLIAGVVPFNSDEAVVALMARHILQGERPVFFYGQAYMGSLDAWLVAGAFRLLGERVIAVRAVQTLLYLGYLLTLWAIAERFSGSRRLASLAVIIAAVPPVLVTTYTTASLGGYGETLVLGNLILWLGYEVTFGAKQDSWKAWLLLGVIAGLAFWTLGMAGVYILPVALIGLWRFRLRRVPLYALCVVGFLIANGPWWGYNLTHAWSGFTLLTRSTLAPTTPWDRLLGLVLLGMPALIGMRFPWSPELAPFPVSLGLLSVYLGWAYFLIRRLRRGDSPAAPGAVALLGVFVAGYLALFVGTHFGGDATGRYLLPLHLPLVLGTAGFIRASWRVTPRYGLAVLAALLLLNGFETWRAAASEERITTQFDPISRFDNRHDAELIGFLQSHGEIRGYSNYWVTFRLAFLTQEAIVYSPRLPYKSDMSYTEGDNRYPAYDEIVSASQRAAYITSKHPRLDAEIRRGFESLGVTFEEAQIGDYHVFYALSRLVRPHEIGLGESSSVR